MTTKRSHAEIAKDTHARATNANKPSLETYREIVNFIQTCVDAAVRPRLADQDEHEAYTDECSARADLLINDVPRRREYDWYDDEAMRGMMGESNSSSGDEEQETTESRELSNFLEMTLLTLETIEEELEEIEHQEDEGFVGTGDKDKLKQRGQWKQLRQDVRSLMARIKIVT